MNLAVIGTLSATLPALTSRSVTKAVVIGRFTRGVLEFDGGPRRSYPSSHRKLL
jgi:hypothetical protein